MLKDLELNNSVILDMKRRNSMPSSDKLGKITKYLGCTTDFLLGISDKATLIEKSYIENDIASQRILNVFNYLDDNYKNKAIAEIIELLNIDLLVKVLDDTSKNNL